MAALPLHLCSETENWAEEKNEGPVSARLLFRRSDDSRQGLSRLAESRGVVGFDVEFVGVYWPPLIAATRALSLSGKSSAIDVSGR